MRPSEADALREEFTRLRAEVRGSLATMTRNLSRKVVKESAAEQRVLEARLAAGDLRGGHWRTRQGSLPPAPATTPLVDRLRHDYAVPAGTLDRTTLSTVGQFDADNALELFFALPGSDYDVYECYIGVAFRQFYATAKAAEAGGSSAPTSGSSSSSSSGSSSASSSGASSATTTGASNTASSASSSSSSTGASSATTTGASDTSSSSNNAAASSASTSGSNASSPSPLQTITPDSPTYSLHEHSHDHTHAHSHGMSHTHSHSHNIAHTHTMPHTHGISHVHDIPHTHNLPHTHDIAHTHNIDHTHTVTISTHAHDLTFGIYKETMPVSWSVTMRLYELVTGTWTLRHTASAITDLVGEVDLSEYVTGAGSWLVTLTSDAAQPNNGRLTAQLYGTVVGAMRAA